MAPLFSPYTSSQYRTSIPSPPSRRRGPPLSAPICDPTFTQHPDVDRHPGSQWVLPGSEANLGLQYAGAPPIATGTPPQLPHIQSPAPEDPMTRLQAEQLPFSGEGMHLATLRNTFPLFFATEVGFALPNNDTMYLPNDPNTYVLGSETFSTHIPPAFGGVERMQHHMAHTNVSHQQTGYNYDGGPLPSCL